MIQSRVAGISMGSIANSTYLDDYPKLGVWPDAYYMSVNFLTASIQRAGSATWQGVQVYASQPRDVVGRTAAHVGVVQP